MTDKRPHGGALSTSDFPDFFGRLWWPDAADGHGGAAFDWQARLVERVCRQRWPDTLDLPTGAGKTSALEIALFALALDAGKIPAERRQPRRIVLVVDRRTVVDQAYRRAVRIADSLLRPRHDVVERVATALRSLQSDPAAPPVLPAILRGGMPREGDWARSPDQPVLLVSTVDQVGSRLLFRGYGVSDRMKPIHAGLLGCDTLYLLDEVHLSRPFEETLAAVSTYARSRSAPGVRPMTVVRMSATPAEPPKDVFGIGDEDRVNPVLRARLGARKHAVLREVQAPKDPTRAREAIARASIAEARRIAAANPSRVRAAAVIVNRVDTARRAAVLARETFGDDWDVELITGRMRPLDRRYLERALERVAAEPGRRAGRAPAEKRLLLVSTQAIEAGADLDFDALVTECASLDALRQRFGRLDRLGELGETAAAIVATSPDVAEGAPPDAVYEGSLGATWRWLVTQAKGAPAEAPIVDFGIAGLDRRLGAIPAEERARLLAPRRIAPVLLHTHLDRWAQTSPLPSADPDVSPFLHGMDRGAPEVQIVWRADVTGEALRAVAARQAGHGESGGCAAPLEIATAIEVAPPSALEALSVPLWSARPWLVAKAARPQDEPVDFPALADVEGAATTGDVGGVIAPVVAWRGGEARVVWAGDALRPGDTVVVPSEYGGLHPELRCWDPLAIEPVSDRGDEAQIVHRGLPVIRWNPAVLASWGLDASLTRSLCAPGDELDEMDLSELREVFDTWREEVLRGAGIPAWADAALRALGDRYHVTGQGGALASTGRRRVPRSDLLKLTGGLGWSGANATDATTEDDGSSFTSVEVSLSRHLAGVRDFARGFAEALGLPPALAGDVELAGWLHDLGKADPRFQLMLHGADPVAEAVAGIPLAKSRVVPRGAQAREQIRERSGYPRGMRHELMSVALLEERKELRARATDWDLVLHLVASHHGYCRPFAPPVLDTEPVPVSIELDGVTLSGSSDHRLVRIDSPVPERFWALVERHGWWALAWLEAIVRLADHRESEKEATNG